MLIKVHIIYIKNNIFDEISFLIAFGVVLSNLTPLIKIELFISFPVFL